MCLAAQAVAGAECDGSVMERAETRCRCEPPSRFHRRPGRSREPMGAQPDTSTSAPEVRYGVRQILAPVFVPRLLVTYLDMGFLSHSGGPPSWKVMSPAFFLQPYSTA